VEKAELVAARKRIREFEAELAVHRRPGQCRSQAGDSWCRSSIRRMWTSSALGRLVGERDNAVVVRMAFAEVEGELIRRVVEQPVA
jgi:hypothetical protein